MDMSYAAWNDVIKYLQRREGPTIQDASCIKAVQSLLRQGMDVNKTDEIGQTLLHKCGNFKALAYILLLNGADVNLQDKNGNTPFHDGYSLQHSHLLWYMGQLGVDLLMENKQSFSRYDNIKRLVDDHFLDKELERLAQRIVERKRMILAACVPERYYGWIEKTFSAKVVDFAGLDVDMELPPCMLVITNVDNVAQEQLCRIKHFQERQSDVEFVYVTLKQLQYGRDHPYWVMGSRAGTEEAYCEMLSYANSLLRSNGLRCVREKWLFWDTAFADGKPEEDICGQTSLWENAKGDYVMVTLSLYRSSDKSVDGIRIEGFHDDVFVTEGIVPVDLPLCDIEKEILDLVE